MRQRPDALDQLPRMSHCHELDDRTAPGRCAIGLPLVRFTLGRMMLAVAIVAMALGLAMSAYRRKERCVLLATHHQAQAMVNSAEARKDDKRGCVLRIGLSTEEEFIDEQTRLYGPAAGLALRETHKHIHTNEAYQKAADRPWTAFILRSFEPE
jgi:hypothetical protein